MAKVWYYHDPEFSGNGMVTSSNHSQESGKHTIREQKECWCIEASSEYTPSHEILGLKNGPFLMNSALTDKYQYSFKM